MSLFDGIPMSSKNYCVLSASRMTDMPAFYPDNIIKEVNQRRVSGTNIHTLVLWTKHPDSLFKTPLNPFLLSLKQDGIQLYLNITITGMGRLIVGEKTDGSPLVLEPHTPFYEEALDLLSALVLLVGNPNRIRLRIDPIVFISDSHGIEYTNVQLFAKIVKRSTEIGIKNFTYSLLEPGIYKKVDNRFKKAGCLIHSHSISERKIISESLLSICNSNGAKLSACSVEGMPVSSCINGYELSELHPQKLPASLKQLHRRSLCGCTESIDLGGWPPKICYSGCLYCYANPSLL